MPRIPRWLKADTAYTETQRTVDRTFLFKPDPETRNIIGAAAGRAQKRYPVKIYFIDFNINHKHTGRAPLSNSPEHLENLFRFDQLFNSLLARGINRKLDREGPIFSGRNRTDEARDNPSLEQQLLYAVTNPVKDGLVDRVAHWKGFSSYNQLATGNAEKFTYVDWTAWHRAGGRRSGKPISAFTKTVSVELSPIPAWEHLTASKRQALFRKRVRQMEQDLREERERAGRGVMGAAKLSKLDPRDRPKSRPVVKSRKPVCHASSVEAAEEYKKSLRDFLDRYWEASGRWMSGMLDVEFPAGSIRAPLLQVCT